MQAAFDELPVPAPWRPLSLAKPAPRVGFRWSVPLLAVIASLHVLAFAWLARAMSPETPSMSPDAIEVSYITRQETRLEPMVVHLPASAEPTPVEPPSETPTETSPDAPPPEPENVPLQIYDAAGRVKLPESLIAELAKVDSNDRVFEYQIPGINAAGTFFDRPPALAYEATRFDQYWQPDQDLLTELLTEAVEKSTKEIRIRIPGNPQAKIVCKVSLLALGGACGVQRNDNGFVLKEDDPATLSAQEQKQCQAWWDLIVAAKSQDIWRKTRALYESECRKPLERKPPEVPLPATAQ
ncbi:hypothetical protein [Arenimonas oryziterrae]|uniref:Uncharacterized protein n=1 Tax=Arenimonas oryziterrae DSM 21050 = YC6267 TaxID=1121015 RepID=A0A091AYY5_9GAMM|nr:hypothetical protein [Arenimonas oryziterrae]KFN44477.1 hypothetical protein N789_00285 [Arenimonas oryziterrae DSM 21050 = YC6267]